MAIATFNPSVGPSPGTTFTPAVKVLEAEFGDGYSQPVYDGINPIKLGLSLAWDGLTEGQMNEIYGFLFQRLATTPFWFTPVGEPAPIKFRCREVTKKRDGGVWSVSAGLVQDFSSVV